MEQQNSQNRDRRGPAPKLEWAEVKHFEQDGLVVVISRAKAGMGAPRFSTLIGAVRKDGTATPHVGFQTANDVTAVVLKVDYATVMSALLVEAQAYIQTELEWDWSQNLDQRIAREQKFMGGGQGQGKPQQPMRPGKTERDKNKGKKAEVPVKAEKTGKAK